MYINNQQIYNSNGLYAHKSYISNDFNGAISENKGVLNCQGYEYEEFRDEIMEALLSEPRQPKLRQPIRIECYLTRVEYYVTRELSARAEVPSRLSARVGLL